MAEIRGIAPASTYGVLNDNDVTRTLNGLDYGSRYKGSDLYDRYCDVARGAGRNPAHPVALGQALSRLGLTRCKITVGGSGPGRRGKGTQVSAWEVPWGLSR